MILNKNNAKAFTSHVKQNMCKALINHQLLLLNSNRKLAFYKFFKTDIKKILFFRCYQKSPSQNCYKQISPRESSTPHWNRESHCSQDTRKFKNLLFVSIKRSWKWISRYVNLHFL